MMKPRIFVSTVSSELARARQLTANVLQGLGYDPVWQDIFGTEPGDLKRVLRDKIDGCEGLIQIVGRAYGAESAVVDPEFGRVSYTQYEFLYARKRKKTTWLLIVEEGCPRDRPLDQLDLPHDPDHPDPAGHQAERRDLQDAWRDRLGRDPHLFHAATSETELELKLERLKGEFADLRRGFRRWQRAVVGIGLASLALGGGIVALQLRMDWILKNWSTQEITTERADQVLREASQQALNRELAEADQAPLVDDREKLREAAKKANQTRIARIADLADDFVALSKREDTSPILQEMIRILNTKEETDPVEKAIAYLERQLGSILDRADTRKRAEQERNRLDLQPVLTAAGLAQTTGHLDVARRNYDDVMKREPEWPNALKNYVWFLCDQSRQVLSQGSIRAALADAEHSLELVERLYSMDESDQDTQRAFSVAVDQMGDVLIRRGQRIGRWGIMSGAWAWPTVC